MDNYLNHRWPQGPGVQPPPVPAGPIRASGSRSGRSPRRWLIPLVSALLCVAVLGGVCFWAVKGITDMISGMSPAIDDPRPWASRRLDSGSDWSPDDLPWGKPDPSVVLSSHAAGARLTGRQVYQNVLPSLVGVEASYPGRFGGYSMGAGVLVTDSGYVLTNYHIIDETVSIRVQLLDGSGLYFSARVIGFDEEFDLAVLKFDPDGVELTPAQLGDSDLLSEGDWVYAIGNPMGYLQGSISVGVVSALDRDEDASGSALGLIQTDAALNPGNSGGALLNEAGQVVGITCAKITGIERESGGSIENAVVREGMGLAIPISDAIPFVNRILATGESWRPVMGINCFASTVDGRKGIQVKDVTGNAAREAGLKKGDLIVSANGRTVTTLVELRRVLYRTGAEKDVDCTVLRGGEELRITFPLTDSMTQSQG